MIRTLRILLIALPLAWAAAILAHRAALAPAAAAVFSVPLPALTAPWRSPSDSDEFRRFMDAIRPHIPERARVVFIGPPTPFRNLRHEDHYKRFLFHMLPRLVRAPRARREIPNLLAWADFVVVFGVRLPGGEVQGFRPILESGGSGHVYRRTETGP